MTASPTAETLVRHELNGLQVRVVEAADPGVTGIRGRVVVETANTLHVEDRSRGGLVQVPKHDAVFEFTLDDGDDGTAAPGETAGDGAGEDRTATHVTVEGDRIAARPARRTERTGDPTWR